MSKVLKHACFAFELFAMTATPSRRVTPPSMFTWQIVTPADRVTLPDRPGKASAGHPTRHVKRDQDNIRNYMDRRVTPAKWVTSPT